MWRGRRGARSPRHRPRASGRGPRANRASPSPGTEGASRGDLFLAARRGRDLLLSAPLLVAFGLGCLAELLEADHLAGGAPIAIRDLVDQGPDADACLRPPSGRLEHGLG